MIEQFKKSQKMNFVFVSLQRINTDRESTSTSLAKELSKNHRVLYVNPPVDRKNWMKDGDGDHFISAHIKRIRNKVEPLEKVNENLWVLSPSRIIESLNWIPSTWLFSLFNYFNNRQFGEEIQKAANAIGFDNFILINDKDIFRSYYLKEILKPDLYIYLDRDYTLGFDYWKRHGVKLEPKLMAKSDGVVCNSLDFKKRAKRYNANSFYIGNGGGMGEALDENRSYSLPQEFKNLKGPLIGYVGALTGHRLDLGLIERLAQHFKEATVVLIGPEDEAFEGSKLHEMANVMFIAKKDKKEIPSYVHHFHVCINPQVKNEITMGNFPLKIVEYLAMGKPTVAIRTNTMQEVFSEHTYLADNAEEFNSKIEQAIEENSEELADKRRVFSRQFSWENVANALLDAIKQIRENGKR